MLTTLANQLEDWQRRARKTATGEETDDELRRRRAARRGNSRPNVKRRGSTYTYYVYVTDADGRRHQHSKGGFQHPASRRGGAHRSA